MKYKLIALLMAVLALLLLETAFGAISEKDIESMDIRSIGYHDFIKQIVDKEDIEVLKKIVKLKNIKHLNRISFDKFPLFHYAILQRKLKTVKFLAESGINVNVRNDYGTSAWDMAVLNKDKELAALIAKNGLSIDKYDYSLLKKAIESKEPLFFKILMGKGLNTDFLIREKTLISAVRSNSPEIVRIILMKANGTDLMEESGALALEEALEINSVEIVKALVKYGLDLNSINRYNDNLICDSMRYKAHDIFRYFLTEANLKKKYSNEEIITLSARSGYIPGIKFALEKGSKISSKLLIQKGLLDDIDDPETLFFVLKKVGKKIKNSKNKNLLIYHLINSNFKIAKALAQSGIDINTKDGEGWTPLHIAAGYGLLEISKLLIDNGADVNAVNSGDIPPIASALACKRKDGTDIALYMIQKGADVNKKYGVSDSNILIFAAEEGNYDVIKYLIEEKGVSVNSVDKKNRNLLIYLSGKDYLKIALYLINKGIDVNGMMDNGLTALHDISQKGELEKVKLLVAHGADPYISATPLGSPYEYAKMYGKTNVMNYYDDLKEEEILKFLNRYGNIPVFSHKRFEKKDKGTVYDNLTGLTWASSDNGKKISWKRANSYCKKLKTGGFSDWRMPSYYELKSIYYPNTPQGLPPQIKISKCNYCPHWTADERKDQAVKFSFRSCEKIWRPKTENYNRILPVRGSLKKTNESDWLAGRYFTNGNTYLHWAAERGRLKVLKKIISLGIDINTRNIYGSTALHLAARNNKLDAAKLLVENGANIKIRDNSQKTALFNAGEKAKVEVVKYLVSLGADVNVRSKDKNTILHELVTWHTQYKKEDIVETIRLLVSKGAKTDLKNSKGKTPLNISDSNRTLYISRIFMEKSINEKPEIIRAVIFNKYEEVKRFSSVPSELNAFDRSKRTALHWAVINKNIKTAVLLLDKGANPGMKDNDGNTPLHYAVKNNDFFLVKLLIGSSADVNSCNKYKNTPLHFACNFPSRKNATEIIRYLIESGADVNKKMRDGETPMHQIAYGGNIDQIKLLLENGADINARANNGWTPLFRAVIYNDNENVIIYMIKNGANKRSKDSEGKSLLYWAEKEKVGVKAYNLLK